MFQFRHILFPVDFSERCRAVRPLVRAMAEKFDARVTMLHTVEIPNISYAGGFDAPYVMPFDVDEVSKNAQKSLSAFCQLDPPLPDWLNFAIEIGQPAESIVEYARRTNVDLIMIPTHGSGKYRSLLLGSVAAKVLHDAPCPVWTASHSEDPAVIGAMHCDSILCAIDLQPGSLELLRTSVELAGAFGAKMRLVHAVPAGAPAAGVLPPDRGLHQSRLQASREEIEALQVQAGTELEVCLDQGEIAAVVRAAALHHDADLVITGHGHLREAFGRLRTHEYSIIRDSPCPVLSM